MQTIIKEFVFNPTIKELMFNADITQIIQQTWVQILFSGAIASILGGGLSGLITYIAMRKIDKLNELRWKKEMDKNWQFWEKRVYKDFECNFWQRFYKVFHITNRFMKPFLRDIIYANENVFVPSMAVLTTDRGKNYFEEWKKHFDELFNLVNGYEDLYLPLKNIDKTHIWIIFALRQVLDENIKNGKLNFDNNCMLDINVYKDLNESFHNYYWDNIKLDRDKVFSELDKLIDTESKRFNAKKMWEYFNKQLDELENILKQVINSDLS